MIPIEQMPKMTNNAVRKPGHAHTAIINMRINQIIIANGMIKGYKRLIYFMITLVNDTNVMFSFFTFR